MCRSLRSSSHSWSRRLIWHHDSRPIVHADSWSKFSQFLVNFLFGKHVLKQLTRKKKMKAVIITIRIYIYEEKSSYLYNMLGLIKSLLSCVTNVLTCSCMCTCRACLHVNVPTYLACLRALVLTCLACLRANVSCVLTCSCVNVSCVLTCQRVLHALVLLYSCTFLLFLLPGKSL